METELITGLSYSIY